MSNDKPTAEESRVLGSAATPKNLVRVEFDGAMVHVMKRTGGAPSRTAFLAKGKLSHADPHVLILHLPRNPDVTTAVQKAEIEAATGKTAQAVAGGFRIRNATGLVFRIVDPGTNGAMKPALDTTPEFNFLVPSLSKVAGVVETELDPAIDQDPQTTADAKFVAFYELDGGVLSATPFCRRARFDPDDESRGKRAFVQRVVLTGETTQPAILQVRKAGTTTWSDLHFGAVDLVRVVFENQPDPRVNNPHFELHEHILKDDIAQTRPWPAIKDSETFCAVSDTVPGCANSAWP